ncbi:MAG: flagellar hook capping FlgD N-terminal domain-containing protein [Brevinematia bacterium]
MSINVLMSPAEITETNYKVDAFNKELKERQKVVSKATLEEADFMKLLITQLKTQDPTKPMEDREFITQMAQFTALKQMNQVGESMKNLVREFAFTRSLGLVNKLVFWNDDNGNTLSGQVESIKVKAGETFLMVDGKEVSPDKIVEVKEMENKREATSSQSQKVDNVTVDKFEHTDNFVFSRF